MSSRSPFPTPSHALFSDVFRRSLALLPCFERASLPAKTAASLAGSPGKEKKKHASSLASRGHCSGGGRCRRSAVSAGTVVEPRPGAANLSFGICSIVVGELQTGSTPVRPRAGVPPRCNIPIPNPCPQVLDPQICQRSDRLVPRRLGCRRSSGRSTWADAEQYPRLRIGAPACLASTRASTGAERDSRGRGVRILRSTNRLIRSVNARAGVSACATALVPGPDPSGPTPGDRSRFGIDTSTTKIHHPTGSRRGRRAAAGGQPARADGPSGLKMPSRNGSGRRGPPLL